MLKSYKNKLLLELKVRNFDLNKFKIENVEIDRKELDDDPFHLELLGSTRLAIVNGIKINLKKSPLSFFLCNSDDSYDLFTVKYNNFIPGFNSSITEELTFETALESFDEWYENDVASFLEELAEPDLWSAFLKEKFSIIDFNNEEENFTVQEKEDAVQAIENFKKDIKNKMELETEELQKINNKLDHLNKKTEQLNKPDWKVFADGIVLNILTSIILDPTQQQKFIELLKNAFSFFPKLIGG